MADVVDGGFRRAARDSVGFGGLIVTGPAGVTGITDAELRASAVPVKDSQATSAAVTRVPASVTVVTLKASNTSRRGLSIFNEIGGATLYVRHGATATTTDYTVAVVAGGLYELPSPVYVGIVTGIWASASGAAQVTEAV